MTKSLLRQDTKQSREAALEEMSLETTAKRTNITVTHLSMVIDHGGRGGTSPPPEFGAGDANANCPPPQILSYRYKNERSVAFKIRQNPFSAGALPSTPLRELTTLPQTP